VLRRVPALLVLALIVACGNDPSTVSTPPVTPTSQPPGAGATQSAAPTAAPTAVASGVASDAAQQTINVTVAGGKVSGPPGRVMVAKGTRLRITVTSDVADEVHVHVYDLRQAVSANASASVEFVADKPGVIEVELETAKLVLARLEIS